jgi:hypothetical protein
MNVACDARFGVILRQTAFRGHGAMLRAAVERPTEKILVVFKRRKPKMVNTRSILILGAFEPIAWQA